MRRRGSLDGRAKRQPHHGPHLHSTVQNQFLPKRLIFSCSPLWGNQNLAFPRGWSPGGGGGRKWAGTARNYQGKLLSSCTVSARASQETEWEHADGRAHQETVLSAGKAFFGFIIFSFCSYYFSEGGGELSWGISLKVYITGEKIPIFCLIGRIFLMQTNITAQRAELLLLPVAENYTLLDGSLMKTLSGGKNGNFAEIAAGTLRKVMLCC